MLFSRKLFCGNNHIKQCFEEGLFYFFGRLCFYTFECAPKSKNFVKFEANGFFDPQLSFDNEDSKKWLNEEVGEIGLFGVGSYLQTFKDINIQQKSNTMHDPRKIKAGLIGGGEGSFIGRIHYNAAMLDGYYELVCGAFSSDAEKSARSAESYRVAADRAYASWQEMLETEASLPKDKRMEVVMIATPNHLHHPQAIMALDKGFHVICDKPVALSLKQALEIDKKVRETGLIFVLTHTYTGYPLIKEAREIVSSGKLGKIRKIIADYPQGWLATPIEQEGQKQASWRTNPEYSGPGGCLGDIGIHAENLAAYITGLEIEELCADITSFVTGRTLDDDVSVLLRYKGGAKGVLMASQVSTGEENDLSVRIYGDKGGIEWHHADPNTLLLKMHEEPVQMIRAGVNYNYLSEKARWNTRVPGGHPEGYIEAFANIYKNAAFDINKHKDKNLSVPDFIEYPTIHDGIEGMKFIEKVIESARSQEKWIRF